MEENILKVWIEINGAVRAGKFLKHISFNQATIINVLNNNDEEITATLLSQKLGIAKPQLVREIKGLEQQGIINKKRSSKDRRKYQLILNKEYLDQYHKNHKDIITLIHRITTNLGERKSKQLYEILTETYHIIKGVDQS